LDERIKIKDERLKLIHLLNSLRIFLRNLFTLFSRTFGIRLAELLLGCGITNLAITSHDLILKMEVCIIVAFAISL
jgi:hypothetical protein